jgi:predicted nucleic acid-binding protein
MVIHVDTNVLLDVLAAREPFCRSSARVWSLAETGRVTGVISAISYNNCFYVVRKYAGREKAFEALRLLRDVFQPVDLTAQVLSQAMDADFADFEDAIQYFSALRAGAETLVTRNPDDFPRAGLGVLTPTEFLAGQVAG